MIHCDQNISGRISVSLSVGKYAVTEVEFGQLLHSLLTCIGEDEGIKFNHHSIGNRLADHSLGDWSYETDNANQITLRYWLNEFASIEQAVTNPTSVMTPQDRTELQNALLAGVRDLRIKVVVERPPLIPSVAAAKKAKPAQEKLSSGLLK
jgi:hypothetical protein